MANGQDKELRRKVQDLARDGRVPCEALLDLAAATGAAPKDLGQICNDLGVKITDCQLGCFP